MRSFADLSIAAILIVLTLPLMAIFSMDQRCRSSRCARVGEPVPQSHQKIPQSHFRWHPVWLMLNAAGPRSVGQHSLERNGPLRTIDEALDTRRR
jgi:hypothetical protein